MSRRANQTYHIEISVLDQFDAIVPNQKRSKIVNYLIKDFIEKKDVKLPSELGIVLNTPPTNSKKELHNER